jgi:hypothetical protein
MVERESARERAKFMGGVRGVQGRVGVWATYFVGRGSRMTVDVSKGNQAGVAG